jgi:hypothetical protein
MGVLVYCAIRSVSSVCCHRTDWQFILWVHNGFHSDKLCFMKSFLLIVMIIIVLLSVRGHILT